GTFMKRCPEECYDLIENMTAHHNDWDTSPQQSGLSSSITSSSDMEITSLKAKMAKINKNLMRPPLAKLKMYMLREPIKIPQPQVVTTNEFTNFMKANDDILKNMQTNMASLTNLDLKLINIFGQFMKMNTASSLGSRTLPANDQREKFFQIFKDLNFNISFADALILMPKFGPSIKILLTNKDKLYELARTPLNEHCLAVLLKKLPEKLRDLGKFLIPCDCPGMAECLALADLGASINLMPLSVWNKLSLLDLSPTCMSLELVDRLISHLVEVAEDVFVKVGTFHFLADFILIYFDADPRVPLILRRSFLKIKIALIDVFEEYSQEVLGFFDVITSGNPSPYYDLIVSTTSLTLSLFENSDFVLEEVDAFLALEDDPTLPEVDRSYVDTEGDILLLEAFLNDDPSLPLLNQGNYLPQVRKELKIYEAKTDKSSIDEPLKLNLKSYLPILNMHF
nr:reverse transcriptase domain-containing protein [Tanacetum cinerariifolium]